MVNKDNEEHSLELRRARLEAAIPDEPEMRKLLKDDAGQMTLRESACYIAGYVAGFASASGDHV